MTFRAPMRDLAFALSAAGHDALLETAFPDLDAATLQAVLEAAAAFAEDVLAPLNQSGDRVGARFDDGRVVLPPGFADAYRRFAAGGWTGLSADLEFGGQGLPKALEVAVMEMVHAANMSFGLCPTLSLGAIEALSRHGTKRQQRLVLPKLVSGDWTGTMNLTEPQAGTDLAALTTKAEPDGEGGYRLTGQKIFISWGDHDAADNICHLVLARLPDAPPGVKGLSLFLATKYLVNDDGSLGPTNALRPGGIEHKLGIHASPTCVMLFEGAKAELVGEPNQGVAHMFVMMNAARLQVGTQGVGVAERAFQRALAYAQERRQGRAVWSAEPSAVIYDHPDVRRTLLLTKARIEAARGICLTTAICADRARLAGSAAERAAARAREELLTPIAKAWSTDAGVLAASAGLQVHGGMGYIEETGAAQHYRDARIAPIYEGTNGVQALDLVGRKLPMANGGVMAELCDEMLLCAEQLIEIPELRSVAARLASAVAALDQASEWMLQNAGAPAQAAATPYLQLAGDVIGGWVLARQALAAAGSTEAWLRSKVALARLYASQILTQAPGQVISLTEGWAELAETPADALAA
ncbi:acyl-CoA dehydrogenase [Phenylobacterium sp. LjRoot219]|uniref:acyl-CoA dehydrogenase n=1 Tax=Phenylobacterium sp. LjRoot219 TaxID=3342283 RepID=UPI003ED05B1E